MIDTDTAVEDFRNRCLCIRHTGQLFIIQIELYLLDIMKLRSSPCDCLQNTQLILLIIVFQRIIKIQGYNAVFDRRGLQGALLCKQWCKALDFLLPAHIGKHECQLILLAHLLTDRYG